MEHVGMDLGKKESQVTILSEAGELIEKRMRTERGRLVRVRARFLALVQALLSREGFRVAPGSSRCFAARMEKLELPEHLTAEVAPLLALLEPLNAQIELLDEKLGELARKD